MVEKWLRDLATYPGILAGRRRDALGAVGKLGQPSLAMRRPHADRHDLAGSSMVSRGGRGGTGSSFADEIALIPLVIGGVVRARIHSGRVVDEGRLAGLMTGRDDDRVGVGDAVEEAVGGVDGSEGGTGPSGEWRRTPVTVTSNAARRRAIWVPMFWRDAPAGGPTYNPPARVWIPVSLPLPSCPVT
jgi:hypothetical protein